MDRLREMELFVRVVETGSFSAAAGDFKLGQPAILRQLQDWKTGWGFVFWSDRPGDSLPPNQGWRSTNAL